MKIEFIPFKAWAFKIVGWPGGGGSIMCPLFSSAYISGFTYIRNVIKISVDKKFQ